MKFFFFAFAVALSSTVACSGQILDVGTHDGGTPEATTLDGGAPDATPDGSSVPVDDASSAWATSAIRATCVAPHGSIHEYGTKQALDALLTTRWYACQGNLPFIDTLDGFTPNAIELRSNGRYRLGIFDSTGAVTWYSGLDYEGTWLSGNGFDGPGEAGRMLVRFTSDLQVHNGGNTDVEPQLFDAPYFLEMGGGRFVQLP